VVKRPKTWVPLSVREIEPRPKKIHEIDGFSIEADLTARQLTDLVTIQGLIKTGGDLSPYYRRSHNRASDRLLAEHHVMHLHLGGPGSDALLYLVQFPEDVLLICVDSHVHVDDMPPGKKLPFFRVSQFAQRLQSEHDERMVKLSAAMRKLLRPKGE
jgi:hypothetical protein